MKRRLLYRAVLPVGRSTRSVPEQVSSKISRILRPWLDEALATGKPMPLPFPAAAGFWASAEERDDGLVVRLIRSFQDGSQPSPSIAMIGVAPDADSLATLWRHLLKITGVVGPMPSGAPCCLIVHDPVHAGDFPETEEWLDDFAEGLARAWLDRQDDGPDRFPGAANGNFSWRWAA